MPSRLSKRYKQTSRRRSKSRRFSRRRRSKYRQTSRRRSKSRRVSRRRRSRRKNIDGAAAIESKQTNVSDNITNVIVFKAPFNCTACTNTENLLKQKGIEYKIYEIESNEYKNKYEQILNNTSSKASKEELDNWGACFSDRNYKCFPRIFVNDKLTVGYKFIGGYKDLLKMLQ